jgi:hypothetical protein
LVSLPEHEEETASVRRGAALSPAKPVVSELLAGGS